MTVLEPRIWKSTYEETLQGKRSVKEIHLDKYGNMEAWIQLRKVGETISVDH